MKRRELCDCLSYGEELGTVLLNVEQVPVGLEGEVHACFEFLGHVLAIQTIDSYTIHIYQTQCLHGFH